MLAEVVRWGLGHHVHPAVLGLGVGLQEDLKGPAKTLNPIDLSDLIAPRDQGDPIGQAGQTDPAVQGEMGERWSQKRCGLMNSKKMNSMAIS